MCFYNGSGWNQTARWNTIFSFVEPGPDRFTFKINKFIFSADKNLNTGDWSYYNGNFYANKAPGTALIGIPVYFILFTIESYWTSDWDDPYLVHFNCYLINFFITVLPVAFGLHCFLIFLASLNVNRNRANLIILILALGSTLMPYSTSLWGHSTAAAFIMMALKYSVFSTRRNNFLCSNFLGFAVLTDFMSIIPAIVLTSYKLLSSRHYAYTLLGTVMPTLLLFYYNFSCFDYIFAMPSQYMNPKFITDQNTFGVFGNLNTEALFQLTLGLKRGIFTHMPILSLALVGSYLWYIRNKKDPWLYITVSIIIFNLLLNSMFNGWHAGDSISARYQIVALPFLVLSLKEYLDHECYYKSFRALTYLSALNMLVISAVGVLLPEDDKNPLYLTAYGLFFSFLTFTERAHGNLTPITLPNKMDVINPNFQKYENITVWNIGELLNMPEHAILIPLALLWIFVIRISLLSSKEQVPESRI